VLEAMAAERLAQFGALSEHQENSGGGRGGTLGRKHESGYGTEDPQSPTHLHQGRLFKNTGFVIGHGNTGLRRLRQKDGKFKASLSHIVKPYIKQTNKQ
jgi:hypothetical protein